MSTTETPPKEGSAVAVGESELQDASEVSDDAPPLETTEGYNIQDVWNRLEFLAGRVEDLEEEKERAEAERDEARRERDVLRERLDDLDTRTDMLQLVEHADDMTAKQRSMALIQHLYRAAKREDDRDRKPTASLNRDEAEAALHHPDVHRTTIYEDMDRAVRLVDNRNVLHYYRSGSEKRLKLSLEGGDVPPALLNGSDNGS